MKTFGTPKFTDKQRDVLLKSIVFLVDTNEKKNQHITENYFDKHNIPYIKHNLKYGDYSFMIPKNEELGIMTDITFENEIVIERKGSLDELAGNFTKGRERIEKEFSISKAKMLLVIEGKYHDICTQNYKSGYNKRSFLATLHTFYERYNVPFVFVEKEDIGKFIYCTMYYHLRELLEG